MAWGFVRDASLRCVLQKLQREKDAEEAKRKAAAAAAAAAEAAAAAKAEEERRRAVEALQPPAVPGQLSSLKTQDQGKLKVPESAAIAPNAREIIDQMEHMSAHVDYWSNEDIYVADGHA